MLNKSSRNQIPTPVSSLYEPSPLVLCQAFSILVGHSSHPSVTQSPSLIWMYPPHLSQRHFQPTSLPPLLKLKAGHSRLEAQHAHQPQKTIHHAFCASTGSPSSTTSNSSTNYLFFTFETLQSPALPYLSIIIQC